MTSRWEHTVTAIRVGPGLGQTPALIQVIEAGLAGLGIVAANDSDHKILARDPKFKFTSPKPGR